MEDKKREYEQMKEGEINIIGLDKEFRKCEHEIKSLKTSSNAEPSSEGLKETHSKITDCRRTIEMQL